MSEDEALMAEITTGRRLGDRGIIWFIVISNIMHCLKNVVHLSKLELSQVYM